MSSLVAIGRSCSYIKCISCCGSLRSIDDNSFKDDKN